MTRIIELSKTKTWWAALSISLVACGPDTLAEAAGRNLSVEEAARLIGEYSQITSDENVVRTVAELWVDYMLLADQVVRDTALAGLDVGAASRPFLEEMMLRQLQDAVIVVDTQIDPEELRRRYESEMPGASATASHILIAYPPDPSPSDRDSVRTLALDLRGRILAGESFEALAAAHSADQGSAQFGGSLGTFERGAMLSAIDEVAFAPGTSAGSPPLGSVSEPVESHLGLHLVRVESIDAPPFEAGVGAFRGRILNERQAAAEATYFAQIDEERSLTLTDDAVAVARAVTRSPYATLGQGADSREIVTFSGGGYPVEDFRTLAQSSGPAFAEQVEAASDEEVAELVLGLGRHRLLVQEASDQGYVPSAAQVDSVQSEARAGILARARTIGLVPASSSSVESTGADPARTATMEALQRVVSGIQEVMPLGGITFLLRSGDDWHVHLDAVGPTLERTREIEREPQGGSPADSTDTP